jgi:hypothetical protein
VLTFGYHMRRERYDWSECETLNFWQLLSLSARDGSRSGSSAANFSRFLSGGVGIERRYN